MAFQPHARAAGSWHPKRIKSSAGRAISTKPLLTAPHRGHHQHICCGARRSSYDELCKTSKKYDQSYTSAIPVLVLALWGALVLEQFCVGRLSHTGITSARRGSITQHGPLSYKLLTYKTWQGESHRSPSSTGLMRLYEWTSHNSKAIYSQNLAHTLLFYEGEAFGDQTRLQMCQKYVYVVFHKKKRSIGTPEHHVFETVRRAVILENRVPCMAKPYPMPTSRRKCHYHQSLHMTCNCTDCTCVFSWCANMVLSKSAIKRYFLFPLLARSLQRGDKEARAPVAVCARANDKSSVPKLTANTL